MRTSACASPNGIAGSACGALRSALQSRRLFLGEMLFDLQRIDVVLHFVAARRAMARWCDLQPERSDEESKIENAPRSIGGDTAANRETFGRAVTIYGRAGLPEFVIRMMTDCAGSGRSNILTRFRRGKLSVECCHQSTPSSLDFLFNKLVSFFAH